MNVVKRDFTATGSTDGGGTGADEPIARYG
jgi:hypothetical protein